MRCDSEDGDQQPKSSYWTQQLFNYEANDSGRFVHSTWNFSWHWDWDKCRNHPLFHLYDDCTSLGNSYIHLKKQKLLENIPAGREYQKVIFKDEVQMDEDWRPEQKILHANGRVVSYGCLVLNNMSPHIPSFSVTCIH